MNLAAFRDFAITILWSGSVFGWMGVLRQAPAVFVYVAYYQAVMHILIVFDAFCVIFLMVRGGMLPGNYYPGKCPSQYFDFISLPFTVVLMTGICSGCRLFGVVS